MPKLTFDPSNHPELTYSDAFLVPHNPLMERLEEVLSQKQQKEVQTLHHAYEIARHNSLSHIQRHGEGESTLQQKAHETYAKFRAYVLDIAEEHPDLIKMYSRDQFDLTPVDDFGNIPLIVSNMNNVTGRRMAEGAAMMGGIAAIPQDKSSKEMKRIAHYLHSRNVPYETPVTIKPSTKIGEFRHLISKRDMSTAAVLNKHGKFVGVLTESDLPRGINADLPVRNWVNRDNLTTGEEGIDHKEALKIMGRTIDFLPVLNQENEVAGAYSHKGAALQLRYQPHIDEYAGGLAMMATIGALNRNPIDRARLLIDLKAKAIVLDTAHFDNGIAAYRNIEKIADEIINRSERHIPIIAGNVVTRSAVRDIFAAGADTAKVGIGPGAMCETRMETGVGRPQLSAVLECAEEAEIYGRHIWADGGVKHPRDVALALAAGASHVMVGSLLTATYESPPNFESDDHGLFKHNYGMASTRASTFRNGSGSNLEGDMMHIFREVVGHRSEGASEVPVYVRNNRASVRDLFHWIGDGTSSAGTYSGARNLKEFKKHAHIGVQTGGGFQEGQSVSKL